MLDKWQTFALLAETLSYTETAEKLFTTQSTISKRIAYLEKQLGVQLIDRSKRQIQLTQAAVHLLPTVQQFMASYDQLNQKVSQIKEKQAATISIVGIPTTTFYQTGMLMGRFHQQFPQTAFYFSEKDATASIQYEVMTGQAELGVIRQFQPIDEQALPQDSQFLSVDVDELIVVLPKAHPLAQAKQVTLAQLAQETFFLLGENTGLYETVQFLFKNEKIQPTIHYQGHRVDVILGFVAQNLGVSFMMKKTAQAYGTKGVVFVPFHQRIESSVGFFRKKTRLSPAAEQFWQFITSYSEMEYEVMKRES